MNTVASCIPGLLSKNKWRVPHSFEVCQRLMRKLFAWLRYVVMNSGKTDLVTSWRKISAAMRRRFLCSVVLKSGLSWSCWSRKWRQRVLTREYEMSWWLSSRFALWRIHCHTCHPQKGKHFQHPCVNFTEVAQFHETKIRFEAWLVGNYSDISK